VAKQGKKPRLHGDDASMGSSQLLNVSTFTLHCSIPSEAKDAAKNIFSRPNPFAAV
jgi:hypothetical protein